MKIDPDKIISPNWKKNKDRVTFTIDPELHKELKRLMKRIDRQKSWLICKAIKDLLQSKIF